MNPVIRNARDQFRPVDVDYLLNVLRENGVAVVPADTVYGLIGRAFDKTVFERLDSIKEDRRLPYAAIFASLESIEEWTGGLSFRQRRLMAGLVPGPMTFVLNPTGRVPQDFRYRSSGIGVRVSSDKLLPKLAEKMGCPIWASSANRSDDPAPTDYLSVSQGVIQSVDMVIDGGPTMFHDASTVVDLRSREFKILREGPWLVRARKAIEKSRQPLSVLVLCSGNICRSPIAAALLSVAAIPHFEVSSAGLDALPGQSASFEMVEIANSWGVDISAHLSRPVTQDDLHNADIILPATPQHMKRVLQLEPRAMRKTFLFASSVGETMIPDPYHLGKEYYYSVAEMIRRAATAWIEKFREISSVEFGSDSIQTSAVPEITTYID